MITYYVYLIKSQKRLVILKNKVDNNDYHEFLTRFPHWKQFVKQYVSNFVVDIYWVVEVMVI
jgi:hypothetical protein